MDSNISTNNSAKKISLSWKIFNVLSKIDTQKISLFVMILMTLQVLIGIFIKATNQTDLIALYFGKTMVIRFLGYSGLVLGAIDLYCRTFIHHEKALKWSFIKRPWIGFFTILLIWSILAIGAASDRPLAIFGSPFRYEGLLSYLAYAGIFVSASLIRDEKYRKTIFVFTTITSTFLAGLTLLKHLAKWSFLMNRGHQVVDYSATFINSNHYGYYLCVSMMVIAGLFMMTEKLHWKIASGACFTLNLVTLLYNASLGTYIAIFIGLILFFAFYWIRKGFKKTWPILILIGIFIALSFVINNHKVVNDLGLVSKQTTEVIGVIGSGSEDTPEGQQAIQHIGSGRGKLWKNTINVMLKNPIIGVGTDNIQHYIDNSIPHNEYLQIGANLGIPGLLLYLAALISCFIYTIKNIKKISDGALIVGMATIVYCISAFVGISIPVATYQLFLFMGMLSGWFKRRDDEKMNLEALESLQKLVSEPTIEKSIEIEEK